MVRPARPRRRPGPGRGPGLAPDRPAGDARWPPGRSCCPARCCPTAAPTATPCCSIGPAGWSSSTPGVTPGTATRSWPSPAIAGGHRRDRQHALAPGSLERQRPPEAAHPGGEGPHHPRGRSRRLRPAGSWPATSTPRKARPADRRSAIRREETAIFIATMAQAESLRRRRAGRAQRRPGRWPDGRSGSASPPARSPPPTSGSTTRRRRWPCSATWSPCRRRSSRRRARPGGRTRSTRSGRPAFSLAVPGHGPTMTRAQFDAYRRAFAAFRGCVGGAAAPAECAAGWTRDVGEFLASDADRTQATRYARLLRGVPAQGRRRQSRLRRRNERCGRAASARRAQVRSTRAGPARARAARAWSAGRRRSR